MASVVTFWQLPSEEEALLRYLSRGGDVVAIRHCEAVPDPAAIRPTPVTDLVGRPDSGRVYFTLRLVVAEPLPLHRWDPESPGDPVRYSLPVAFPAIVYDAGSLVGRQLSQSNAAAYPAQAPAEVAAWMQRVFGWLRRASPHWHEYPGYRVTDLAAEAALDGLLLVPYHGWQGTPTGRSSFAPRRAGRPDQSAAADSPRD
jgi:hypothetical protein